MNDARVDSLMPSAVERIQLDRHVESLIILNETQLDLQHKGSTILTVRENLDFVIGSKSEMKPSLKSI